MKKPTFAKTGLLCLLALFTVSGAFASVKCSATLINNTNGGESRVELTLASGDELKASGYEKSEVTGSRVRSSEVYALISAGQFGTIILEIPSIRAERGAGGYLVDVPTFQQIVTRGKINTKSFNTELVFSLDHLRMLP